MRVAAQRVRFFGGNADGLLDDVDEIAPGRLPPNVETMGSLYRLAEPRGERSEYHVTTKVDGFTGIIAPPHAG